MLEQAAGLIIQLIHSTGYFGIFILMALESTLIPIPSEVTMPFAGFLASTGALNIWLVVIVGTVANLAGSLVAYYLGFFLEETVLLKLINKYGKFILVDENDYLRANKWFDKYGDKVVFISRLLPGVRTIISLPAGVFKMDIKKFVIYTTVGCFLWSVFLTYMGVVLGANWKALDPYYRKFEIVIILALIMGVVWYLDHKLNLRKRLFKR